MRALEEAANGQSLILITASFLLPSIGKVAEESRHMKDTSIIHYASHFKMVSEIQNLSIKVHNHIIIVFIAMLTLIHRGTMTALLNRAI